jgi:nucleoside-diphosphate-sugar epimerase
MKVLILGGSGATGKLVGMQLIKRQINCRVVVRENAILPENMIDNPLIEIKRGNISEFDNSEMKSLIQGCNAIVCCLGHNITMKGMFGKPRNLVFDTIKKVCEEAKEKTGIRIILMSTTACTNSKIGEKKSLWEKLILSILKLLLPPHLDNVKAADCLQNDIKESTGTIEWVAVRPDTLINNDAESAYEVFDSPIRSPLFDAGTVSRINVSNFMIRLLTNNDLWQQWRFKMPVVYNECTKTRSVKESVGRSPLICEHY